MARYYVGVDVGGTKMLAAVVDEDDGIHGKAKADTPADNSENLMEALEQVIHQAIQDSGIKLKQVAAIGLGVPGVVGDNGECIWAPNCPLTGVPVAEILSSQFGVPVVVGNDVNVGTFGERSSGAARGYDSAFGMFVGTGIGGGLVVHGQVIVGHHALGAEVGHIIVDHEAARTGAEGGGEFEWYASRLGIERRIRQGLAEGGSSSIADQLGDADDRIKSGVLSDAIDAGDELVTEALTWASEVIGIASVTVIHLCDPEVIVYGGGVIEACGDFMLPLIEAAVRAHVAPGNGRPLRLVRSELGDNAVWLGAVALAKSAGGQKSDYPVVLAPEFGVVMVDGERMGNDVVVRANGKVVRRKKKLSRAVHGTAHEVSLEEIRYVCKGKPEYLYIGHGHHGHLALSRDARDWLDQQGIPVSLLPTSEAAAVFSHASGRRALLLHATC
ncbi:MAG: ROK family protein [Armatimonadetes bacterium]|nr:ROK family protein [Armatimonadota bacterium]